MFEELHPALEKVSKFVSLKNSENLSTLYSQGYLYIQNRIY